MQCDLCGSQTELYQAVVEGSIVDVCRNCLKFGKQLEKKESFDVDKLIKINKKLKEENLSFLRNDYNILIKDKREKLNLTQEELAKKLNEKISVIQKLETKSMTPNDKLVKKLEDFFGFKLTETYDSDNIDISLKKQTLTIGDLIKFKKK
ncbi:TIGR00270 family protein [Candidatus Woesearchaeota archaeon]|nr:TIGR00270 family protein [Candidatus Woesearchaeota archaeon]